MAHVRGRISELGFKVTIGVTFGITILSATVRLFVRLRYQKRLYLDDYLMMIACLFLISGTILLYLGTSAIFFIESVSLNGEEALAAVDLEYFLKQLLFYQRINWAYLALTWATVFFVKFAFLAFFRHLLDRVPSMYKYWKLLVGFTTLVFAFAVCDGFIACPVLGLASLQCAANHVRLQTALGIGATVISLDILTDVLILIIPVSLLWRVQIKPRQKLGLGAFLCLSIVMVIMAIIRVSGIHYHGIFDNSWIYLWQQVEACTAVTMISMTAFRSVFVANSSDRLRKNQAKPWQVSVSRILRRQKRQVHDDQDLEDLTIPSATLTGMESFIRGHPLDNLRSENETIISEEGKQVMNSNENL